MSNEQDEITFSYPFFLGPPNLLSRSDHCHLYINFGIDHGILHQMVFLVVQVTRELKGSFLLSMIVSYLR